MSALALSQDGRTAYASNIFSPSISVVDLDAGTVTGTIAVNDAEGIDLTPDGSRVVVLDKTDDRIVDVDRASGSVLHTVQLGKGAHPRAYGAFIR